MDLYDAVRRRKSVRSFLPRPVEREKLDRVLDAARLAPSARNTQEWRFVVVEDGETRKRIAEAASSQQFVAEAPVVLACCAETDHRLMRCGHPSFAIDVAIAIDHLTLAATAEGLGTCWVGSFNADELRTILGIPPTVEVIELLPLGYPVDGNEKPKDRLGIEKIVYFERWRKA